jgi:hypothetical protein
MARCQSLRGSVFKRCGVCEVRPGGLEPPTHSLEGCCSIHLSYGRPMSYKVIRIHSVEDSAQARLSDGRPVGGAIALALALVFGSRIRTTPRCFGTCSGATVGTSP